jgi:NADH-quinone oxidoreductase subunit J
MELAIIGVWSFFALLILSALGWLLYTRKVIHAGIALFVILLALTGNFVLAQADFLALAQILVYVGGILLLLLFGVMLSSRYGTGTDQPRTQVAQQLPVFIICLIIFTGLIRRTLPEPPIQHQLPGQTTAFRLGVHLFSDYLIVFELSSLFLLVALIAAASLARQNNDKNKLN